MSEPELIWLREQAKKREAVAEIGCWMGKTTRELSLACPGTVYAVDTWRGSSEHQSMLTGKPEDWLYEQFLGNIAGCINIVAIRRPSVEAAQYLKASGVKLDMVFIDAGHEYENVKADILAWMPLLKPNGLLSGHDFDAGRAGVIQAVRELIGEPKRAPGSIWYR